MKCPNCNFENIGSSDFCQECGFDLSIKSHKKSIHKELEEIEDVIFNPEKKKGGIAKLILISLAVLGGLFVLLVMWYAIFPEEDTPTNFSSTPTTETSYNDEWRSFTSTEHGFSINFPADYESERIPEELLDNGYSYSGIQYLSSPSDDEIYMVQVGDYDIYPSDYDNRIGLEGVVNGMTDSETSLTSSSFTTFRGYDAINFTLSTKGGYFAKGIAFIKDDTAFIKLYLMAVFNRTADFSDFGKFTNSFKSR
ncbi:hypothetical protein LRY65_05335 [Candidatus Woesebacteria bacterium]|nr:hypothetical protein [Candidatus Woesebacteria bacterium]MCD8506687.1 hypothetical protein [Candidatus Woesebacteria bacterium]MCD8527592.1 hypothetical protein [Candidatus Woesebacteria bacterium]MCD8546436.1 hypothetical protein [Candidatus Woesebacteria bacterium]